MESPLVSLVSDLRVKREKLTVIHPQKNIERRSFFLSNIDQKLVRYILKYVHFFSAHPDIPFDALVFLSTQALSKILVEYQFICGRLTFNSDQGRFEIDCNAAGVPLAICTSDLCLEELGDIIHPNPAFSQLCFLPGSENQTPTFEDEHLISFQATRFKCGGFVVGTAVNHSLMDGVSMQEFSKNFTHLAMRGDLAFVPVTDRACLKARSPLQINYDHLEYKMMKPSVLYPKSMNPTAFMRSNNDPWQNKLPLNTPSEKRDLRMFSLSGKLLDVLKMKARDGGVNHCTKFIAALAHLWRARTATIGNMNAEDVSTVQFAVDIRSKVIPPFPREFVGNAIAAYAKATAKGLQEQPFSETVKKLQEGVDRLTDDYLKSRIDWLELHDGVTCIDNGFFVTSWSHMEFRKMELGLGIRSVYEGPVVEGRVNGVIFLVDPKDEGGIIIYMGLEPNHMLRFQELFQKVDGHI